jgi:hypothetical protein
MVEVEMTDVVAETSLVLAERTRLPRLRSLAMGGGATVALAALAALVAPNIGTGASSAPGSAPELQLSGLSAVAPRLDGSELAALNAMKYADVLHDTVAQVAKDRPVPASPSLAGHAGASLANGSPAQSATSKSHAASNVQDAARANANGNTQMTANSVTVTSSDKHVNSNRSVNVSNSTVQNVTSGSVQNSVSVSSSETVSRSHDFSLSSP